MRFPAKKISTEDITVKIGGKDWKVEIFETDFQYPHLARWTEAGTTVAKEEDEIWTVANHFFVSPGNQDLLDTARNRAEELTGMNLQFRSASATGSSFRVEPAPATPNFRQVVASGRMMTALSAFHNELGVANAITEPDYVIGVDPRPGKPSGQDFLLQMARTLSLIRAEQAWAIHDGSKAVTVAVIDTGVDYRHPDLDDNIFRHNGQLVGSNLYGNPLDPDDVHWHGTYGAGLIGAEGDNGIGITGVCPKCNLMPIRAFSDRGMGRSSEAAGAIRLAADEGADVILCAWGSPIREELGTCDIEKAIKHAGEKGVLVVASAGNHRGDTLHFPASFSFKDKINNVIAVGGTNEDGLHEPEWGRRPVDISAPGTAVYSTLPTRLDSFVPYAVNSGTSPAAALVAGACALLKSYAKAKGLQADYKMIKQALIDSATPFESGEPGRRLNVEGALRTLEALANGPQPVADARPAADPQSGTERKTKTKSRTATPTEEYSSLPPNGREPDPAPDQP